MFCQIYFHVFLFLFPMSTNGFLLFIYRPSIRTRIPIQRANTTITKRSKKAEEPVILTLSSDEEDDETSNSKVINFYVGFLGIYFQKLKKKSAISTSVA